MIHSLWDLFFVPVGLEPQVRVWGARGALPVADEATRASGRGRQMPRSAVDAGRCRAPQQDTGTTTNTAMDFYYFRCGIFFARNKIRLVY